MIRVEKLVVTYRSGLKAVDNVSLEIPSKHITCILGPNGAGKSSLLKALSKLVPFNGSVLLNGLEVAKQPLKTIAKLVAYASQLYVHELLSLTVLDALIMSRYPVSRRFFEDSRDYEVVHSIAHELFIDDMLDRKLSELSSGELQRVILALALVKQPRYLFLDELDAHVDIGVKSMIARLIKKWRLNHVVVFTTQDILFGTSIGEFFIVLDKGRVVFKGFREELLRRKEVLEDVYGVEIASIEYRGEKLLIPIYSL